MAGANIVVRGGAGNDILNASALGNTYNSLEIQGEAGDDVVTGGGKADTLGGGEGDDRVVGAQGGDLMSGGAGNDVLVWNNGDGSDTMDGDAGNDEIEVNGSANAGDEFTIAPGANGRTKFDRVNLVPFTLDTLAERMTVSGLGGNEKMTGAPGLAGRILLTLNGNAGADALTGGDGADRISGGEAADVLDGGAGDDDVTGDRGADQMLGGAGEDVLEWNNGDGSDVATGGAGADLVRVNGSVTDGDAMEVAPAGQGIRFQRTNLVPFTIDLDTESIEMNGLGGDDTIAAKPGLAGRLGVLADGGSGNDRIEVRNGAADSAEGGSGTDSAIVDRADIVSGVESVDRPPRSVAKIVGKARLVCRGRSAGRGLLREDPGGRRVRLHRCAPPDHRQGDPDRRHQAPRRAGEPQVRRRPGRDGPGQGAAARQRQVAGQARQAEGACRGLLTGGRLAHPDRAQRDAGVPAPLSGRPTPRSVRAPGSTGGRGRVTTAARPPRLPPGTALGSPSRGSHAPRSISTSASPISGPASARRARPRWRTAT